MKILQLATIVAFILLSFSCAGIKKYVYYHLENGTKHSIRIKIFHDDAVYPVFRDISLEEGQYYTGKSQGGEYECGFSAFCAFDSPDSLVIIFDDNRKAKIISRGSNALLEGIDKNLLLDYPYTIEGNGNYRYVFTEEDYNNAIEF